MAKARAVAAHDYTDKPCAFVDCVLAQYVRDCVDELSSEKLSPLLTLKYHNAPQTEPPTVFVVT